MKPRRHHNNTGLRDLESHALKQPVSCYLRRGHHSKPRRTDLFTHA